MENVFDIAINAFAAPIEWFKDILEGISGADALIMAVFSILVIFTLLIKPLRGGITRGSDRAKKNKGGNEDE